MKRNILFLLSICVLLFSCSDKDDPIKEIEKPNVETKDPFITLKKSNIDFTNEGGSESILIESNVTWTTKSSASWCTVTPTSGNKSTESITLSAPANKEYDNRSCTVTIESGNITKTITVNQGENLGLLITQDKYELGNEESTIKVEVKANVEFEVEINDKWISKVDTRGLTTSQVEFKIAENDTYGNREGSITIKQKGGNMSSTITIFQSQEDAIILSEKDFELTSKAQSVELEIKTNIDYEVIIPEDAKGWVTNATTRALRTETVVLDITENKDHAERTAKVIVKNKKTNLQEVVTIKQAANTGLIINTDKYEVSNDGGTIEVEVKANVEFDIEISDNWITRVETRGLTATKLQFQVAKNQDYDNREGSITIKQKGGNLSSTIKVYQSQKDAIILSEKIVDLSQEKQAIQVELKTNVEFQVIIPEAAKSWVSYTPTRGLRTENLTLNISENKDYNGRSTEIYVKDKKTNLQDTLTINQAANLGFTVSKEKFDLNNEATTIEVDVEANFDFDVKISDNWITQVETRGLTSTKLIFSIAKNTSYDSREGTITIKQKGGDLSSTIKVYQSQKDAIIISEKIFDLTSEKQAIQVELKTNVEFEVIISEAAKSWVSYTPTRGLRTENLTLNISENKDYTDRSTEIYVKDKKTNLQDTLTINQTENLGFTVSKEKFDLNNEATTIEVDVEANFDFDVKISDNWITQVETRGLTSTKLIFSIAKNTSYDSREGTITIKQKGGDLSSTIKVYQSQKDAIIISEKIFDLTSEKQAIQVELKTNVEFEVIISEAAKSWVSYTPTRGLRTENLTLNISENKDYNGRSTEIYVKDKKTNLQDTLTINQAANTGLIVSPDKYELTNDGATFNVEVKANVDYKVSINDTWLTQIKTRGLTTTNLTFEAAKNESYSNREGTITISQTDGNLSSTITVYQSQENAIILSEKDYNLSREYHTLKIELKTNVDFEVNIPTESKKWVSYTPTRGLREETLILNISENTDYGTRSAKVYVKDKETNLQEAITITQAGVVVDEVWVEKMGTLGKILSEEQKSSIEAITVKGEINKVDFEVMKYDMPKLKYIDLKEVKCEGDRIPEFAFGDFAYENPNKNISTIILPESITAIGKRSFSNCSGLTGNLIIPDGVTTIGENAFQGCSGFTGNLILPDGLTTIGDVAFAGCKGFTGDLILPDGVTTIGGYAFSGCSGFTGNLNIPDGVTKIGSVAFSYCTGFTGSLILPDGVTTIGENAFQNCRGFTGSLILPDGVTTIGKKAFLDCRGFTGDLIIPGNVTTIGKEAFQNCSGLTGNLTISDGITTIGNEAFIGASNFKGNLILPDGLTTIGGEAFYGCTGFTGSLILPDGLTTIGRSAFYSCRGFTGNLILPDGVTTIEPNTFAGCSRLTGLTLGKDVTTINERAFYACSNITGNVVFPKSLTSTRNESFYGCNKVEAFQFPHTTPLGYYPNMLPSGATVKVPTSAVATYKATNGWKDHSIVGY